MNFKWDGYTVERNGKIKTKLEVSFVLSEGPNAITFEHCIIRTGGRCAWQRSYRREYISHTSETSYPHYMEGDLI
jgi:hypothetical protein